MYISAHAENIVGIPDNEGLDLIWELTNHATQRKCLWEYKWTGRGDSVTWDNRNTMRKVTEWTWNHTDRVRDMRQI